MRKKTYEEFKKEGLLKHKNKYGYEKFVYVNNCAKGMIICPIHGIFVQTPAVHLGGCGCPKCGTERGAHYTTCTKEEFEQKANLVHNNKYSYLKTVYINNKNKIVITCPAHGDFEQEAGSHLKGCGCPLCYIDALRATTDETIKKANLIHNSKYIYNNFVYINRRTKAIITCPIHGEFKQTPYDHLGGHGCPKCAHTISKPCVLWLDGFNNPDIVREYTITINNKKYKVDGFNKHTNTVYEFYGDYWHGNPNVFKFVELNTATKQTFGQLYDKTIKREAELKKAGYSIITIWEDDFNNSSRKI